MEVHFNPDLQARLTQRALQQGRNPDEVVQDVVARYFEEEDRFVEAVKRGDKPVVYLEQLMKLSETMKITAKCGLGQSVANSFSSIVNNFKEEMIY